MRKNDNKLYIDPVIADGIFSKRSPYGCILLDIKRNKYYYINETAYYLLNQLNGKRDLRAIIKNYSRKHRVDFMRAKKDVVDSLLHFRKIGSINWL